jgi:hypothetical protein
MGIGAGGIVGATITAAVKAIPLLALLRLIKRQTGLPLFSLSQYSLP